MPFLFTPSVQAGLPSAIAWLRDRVPASCPACGGRASGGRVCAGCRADLLGLDAAGRPVRARCRWCAVLLPAERGRAAAGGVGSARGYGVGGPVAADVAVAVAAAANVAAAGAADQVTGHATDHVAGAAPSSVCAECVMRPLAFDRAIAAIDYAAPGDALVSQLKRRRRYGRALALGDLLADAVSRDAHGLPPGTMLVPIPASRTGLRQRGFNPAAEIARAAAGYLGLPVRSGVLRLRADDAPRQATLARADRLERGAAGRFVAIGSLDGLAVAVVDDVMTTGSTLHAAALALRAAGADPVIALAAARTPPPGQ